MSGNYRLAPLFIIRMAGRPFEVVEGLATREISSATRAILNRLQTFEITRQELSHLLETSPHKFAPGVRKALRGAVPAGQPLTKTPESLPAEIRRYDEDAAQNRELLNSLGESLLLAVEAARGKLWQEAHHNLPAYLVFGSDDVHNLLASSELLTEPARPRNKTARVRERHLLLYLQRVATKNDTFSGFGPASWGTVSSHVTGLEYSRGAAQRSEIYLENWTAAAIASAINADQEALSELAPRLNPNVRLADGGAVFTDTGAFLALDDIALERVALCGGETPAHSLGISYDHLEGLAKDNLIWWRMEVPALNPNGVSSILASVSSWRQGPAKSRWLDRIREILDCAARFAQIKEPVTRLAIMNEARERLKDLGASREANRSLYAAANPIGEACFYPTDFRISEKMADHFTDAAEPWIDLWRDSYAFIASRVVAGLRSLLETAPIVSGSIPLPAFLLHCESRKMSLLGPGLVGLAHMGFQEVKKLLIEILGTRVEADQCELTLDDCHSVRRNFSYEKFDEYTYPSADLQISATSVESVNSGDYEWILGELHPPIAMLHHCFFWSCPDNEAFSRALTLTLRNRPNFYYGFYPADFTAHTTVRQFGALPHLSNFVATKRGDPAWRIIPPSETEVFINEENGDVGLRKRGSHEYLGSFARYWIIPLGFHPFFFGRAPRMPRLRCGKVIVQRESWTITREELGEGNFTGISRDLVVAVERLRAARNLPRYLYIRPTEQALRRSGAEGRDKDTKPVFIDLESYLFLEIFLRWLTKAGEIEATEMLPDPDHLLWREKDGRHTFELRTLIVPRE